MFVCSWDYRRFILELLNRKHFYIVQVSLKNIKSIYIGQELSKKDFIIHTSSYRLDDRKRGRRKSLPVEEDVLVFI